MSGERKEVMGKQFRMSFEPPASVEKLPPSLEKTGGTMGARPCLLGMSPLHPSFIMMSKTGHP